jgi:hypothetical protein
VRQLAIAIEVDWQVVFMRSNPEIFCPKCRYNRATRVSGSERNGLLKLGGVDDYRF